MPIIIDGWNFLRDRSSRIKEDSIDHLSSARTLISYLESFQMLHKDPIVLVFDSKYEHLEINYRNSSKLKIVPAKDADGYIKRYIDNIPEKQRRNIRVVSSDNDVYYHAKSAYATPLRCGEFWEKLCRNNDRTGCEY